MFAVISYSEAGNKLASLMDSVCKRDVAVPARVKKARPVVLMSADGYSSVQETAYRKR